MRNFKLWSSLSFTLVVTRHFAAVQTVIFHFKRPKVKVKVKVTGRQKSK